MNKNEAFLDIYRSIIGQFISSKDVQNILDSFPQGKISETTLTKSFLKLYSSLLDVTLYRALEVDSQIYFKENKSNDYHQYLTGFDLNACLSKYHSKNSFDLQCRFLKDALLQFYLRLAADIREIESHILVGEKIEVITEVSPVGDFHGALECGFCIGFKSQLKESGEFYYKPRLSDLFEKYNNFITWLNEVETSAMLDNIALKNINKQDYSWIQSVHAILTATADHQRLSSALQGQNDHLAFERFGALLCLAYVFSSCDLHYENIVFNGDYPVIVDIETIFSGKWHKYQEVGHLYDTLMLPRSILNREEEASPLTYDINRKNAFEAHIDDLIVGFEKTYDLIMKIKPDFIAKVNELFSDIDYRVILRGTKTYFNIIKNINHPVTLIKQSQALEINKMYEVDLPTALYQYEAEQLKSASIPIFYAKFDSKKLCSYDGKVLFTKMEKSAKDLFDIKIKLLSNKDKENQINNILVAKKAFVARRDGITLTEISPDINTLERKDFFDAGVSHIEIIKSMWQRLVNKLCYISSTAHMSTIILENNTWNGLASLDLYNGTPGILLVWHQLNSVLNIKKTKHYKTIRNDIKNYLYRERITYEPSLYQGLVGCLYVYIITSENLLEELPVIQVALQKIAYGASALEVKSVLDLDVIKGLSGIVLGLLTIKGQLQSYHAISKSLGCICQSVVLKIVNALDQHLNDKTLLGFAHGTAGIIAALSAYMNHYGRNIQYIKVINMLMKRERSFFDPSINHWRRPDNGQSDESWCHGSIGIVLSKLYARRYINIDFDKEIEIVLTHMEYSKSANLNLCHGLAGYLEFLNTILTMSQLEIKESTKRRCEQVKESLIQKINLIYLNYGVLVDNYYHEDELPGLLSGTAGFLLTLLSSHERNVVDSMLSIGVH
ncbi:hypothetical protein AVI51_14495 [Piscirickettsia salmonis]|uniref:Type 2 lantibiotic biosynthesis protein LanM n=1 Tax=Piscirickettsia salmonis TaxID=1238 RepID=A0A9Q5VK77_PISSA|nr:DUF4135 domain-containing protein [Piscirickettsia salmonis]ALA24238.1 type 2 lantibiotic biosynthesis LanM family protein [Piscirickettsia salmonis]APS44626.1 hypothetical protein AVI48_09770 [Piscirickettsia salmonis]APS47986.1 hypothetical protein AVI49_10375 [Piscirickettsia salmonis]APS51943.1 hypothetical protein AVI50_14640 [Piscirickettsia salmonis]APS55160.1 hypothetical protein AVI51_14495 [Piscirickettsia salmonis]